ncbi:MAG: 4-hydroxythreonine-4-phosphate dehydrogenase PdxA [Helicobacter sp.]|nr:4-hydroxythreonine-4-phosphate dehydrogenase PdxA [Helicobacter sp.]
MRFYVSIGDVNGISTEIALRSFARLHALGMDAIYGIDSALLESARALLGMPHDVAQQLQPCALAALDLREDFARLFPHARSLQIMHALAPIALPDICAGEVSASAGLYACKSFLYGIMQAMRGEVSALLTLPVHKRAWSEAQIAFAGHTELLRALFGVEVIMVLGCEAMMVALYTDHIPLNAVSARVLEGGGDKLADFLLRLARSPLAAREIAVLGLNPHAGDGGCIGSEDSIIATAIGRANHALARDVFVGPLVPDVAFAPKMRARFQTFVAMYHDQGLIPLKALHFDQSVQISVGLPIVRVRVDHGPAGDIAYKIQNPSTTSLITAFFGAEKLVKKEDLR